MEHGGILQDECFSQDASKNGLLGSGTQPRACSTEQDRDSRAEAAPAVDFHFRLSLPKPGEPNPSSKTTLAAGGETVSGVGVGRSSLCSDPHWTSKPPPFPAVSCLRDPDPPTKPPGTDWEG